MAAAMRTSVLRQALAAQRSSVFASSMQTSMPRIASPAITRVAAFHASQKREILPPLPQRIKGTVNDPVAVPHAHPVHGSYHWTMERTISAALVPLTIAPFASGSLSPIIDATLAAAILVHSHIGFQSIIIDYLPGYRTPKSKKAFEWLLNLATLTVAVGLYEFETNDVGLAQGIKRVWTGKA